MPVSTDASKPISLLFEFHGSYEFEAGEEVPNPISGISETHVLNQKAIKENYIICYPAGWPEFQQDSSGAVNWAGENYTRSLPFIDAMLKYFTQDNEPQVDPNRIYSTGQSSGAILSFPWLFTALNNLQQSLHGPAKVLPQIPFRPAQFRSGYSPVRKTKLLYTVQ